MTKPHVISNPSTAHWAKVRLPHELEGLSMAQITAVRKMVQAAFTAGRKYQRGLITH